VERQEGLVKGRPVDVARLCLGTAALVGPGLFVRWGRAPAERRVRGTVRVLGVRYVVQSGAGFALDRSWVPPTDAAVDLAHAASMGVLAVSAPRFRRLALGSAATAVVFATADLRGRRR
jgi:hypothetical protein